MRKLTDNLLKIAVSLLLGGVILWWMYRDFDFGQLRDVLSHRMNWGWMLLSLPFGVLAQFCRGWRWRQTLEPVDEHPRASTCVHAVFLSYALSLIVPRIGEFARCGVLKRYDGVSFPKALGTVVTERIIDSSLVALIAGITLLCQLRVFNTFFERTGTTIDGIFSRFTATGYLVTAVCVAAAAGLVWLLLRRLSFFHRVKEALYGLWQGITSLSSVRNLPLFIVLTLGIWVSYFLHYYLTFFCFEATEHLSVLCGLVTFIVGSMAVIVPTPNGAGPWHFAVKTMLILYGVAQTDALFFVLIVHGIQTLLVILLGVYAWTMLMIRGKKNPNQSIIQP